MTFAKSNKPYSCWDCDHFVPVDRSVSVSGWCRKYAPRGLSLWGFQSVTGSSPLTTKGDVYTHDAASDARLPVGTNGQIIVADDSEPTGLKWEDQQTATLTTKGDVLSHNGTNQTRLPVGTNGNVLTANSAAPNGVEWSPAPSSPSPLTTKGDVYTHDAASDARLPVGTDGQFLAADSTEPSGLKWDTPPGGSSPLTTKGDLYTRDAASDARLPVGTDGQYLIADSTETDGLRWANGPTPGGVYLITKEAARFDTNQSTVILFSRDGEPPGSGSVKAISNPNTNYDNGGSFPFNVPGTAEIVAFQINVSAMATGVGTVGTNPALEIEFFQVSGQIETSLGVTLVPSNPAQTTTNFNTGTPDFQSVVHILTTPISVGTDVMFGWRANCGGAQNENKIGAVRNINCECYLSVTPVPETLAAYSKSSPAARLGIVDPDEITEIESFNKWALIQYGPNEWCGEYKPARGPIPTPPPFTPPEP